MFRRWPHFQRLLSWTKPFAPVERASRAYQRYDWNSLLAEEADATALQPGQIVDVELQSNETGVASAQ